MLNNVQKVKQEYNQERTFIQVPKSFHRHIKITAVTNDYSITEFLVLVANAGLQALNYPVYHQNNINSRNGQ